jgi:hypothetical protein
MRCIIEGQTPAKRQVVISLPAADVQAPLGFSGMGYFHSD